MAEEQEHGWAPDVGTGGSEKATEAKRKAFEGPPPGEAPGREVSEEERTGVPPTDTEARTPLGVGESTTQRAEDYGSEASEGSTHGTKGESQRPYGTTEPAGVDPPEPIDPERPDLPSGDQGG